MTKPNNMIKTEAILKALARMGLEAQLVGKHRTVHLFCSLKSIERGGLFYATDRVAVLPTLVDSVVICNSIRADIDRSTNSLIVTENPQLAFYLLQRIYHPGSHRAGVHPTALVNNDADIDPSAFVGPYCVIGNARVGPGCSLESHVVLNDEVSLEAQVTIESHTTLGATGVAWAWDQRGHRKVVQPQTGGVKIGHGCFIGSNVTIVRGSVNECTTLGDECMVAHGTKIGHGCVIGALVHFANNVTIAGNVTIEAESFLSSGCVVRPHIKLPRGTVVGAGAVVVKSPEDEFTTLIGVPAHPIETTKAHHVGLPVRAMGTDRNPREE